MRSDLSLIALLIAAPVVLSQSQTVPPPPAESTGCVLHDDHYHCDGPATPTSVSPSVPSPTNSGHCHWHETHWDCEGEGAHAEDDHDHDEHAHDEEGHDDHDHDEETTGSAAAAGHAEEEGACVIHVGHTHGDCSAEDLACGQILLQEYNMPLHIGAVFIILVTSGLGVMIPLIAGWRRHSDATENLNASSFGRGIGFWGNFFFIARHFGTGIILSTAFIHLLFHGIIMFNNECIGHMTYESTASAIALASAFVTFLIDFIGSRAAAATLHNHRTSDPSSPSSPGTAAEEGKETPVRDPFDGVCAHTEAVRKEELWQLSLLEAGIIFHSIMIGVTLGAGSGSGWTTLLIVIVFHQFFEGAALGARITLLFWISKFKHFLFGLGFALITPIGVGIGIGVRQSFAQNGKAALLSVGILNSISAGILLYTAFKLLAVDFTTGPLRTAPWRTVVVAIAALTVGMIAMSVLGKWA